MAPSKKLLNFINPGLVFGYQVTLMLVSFIALWWFTSAPGRAPDMSWTKVVPLWVPFGGWLGGITISIVGVATHTHDWNRQMYGYWHLARPLLGLITGSVAVLIVLFVVTGVSGSPIPSGEETYEPSGIAVLFVLAFVVGYREETFRELVKRVLDVILTPGDKAAEQKITLVPARTVLTARRGESVSGTVTLVNTTGDTFDISQVTPRFDPTISNLTVALAPGNGQLGPGQSAELTVTWEPQAAATSSETSLVVAVGGYRVTSVVRPTVGT
ncbi:hypothetical protein [Nocardioides sp.]|uniref:hypothetical protein n=1 Tax=Nocardioides sp. TaxID=35761 RepID=UPI0035B25FCA